MGQLSDAKVRSLVVGFVRLKTSMINRVSESAGIDLKAFFDPNVINDGQGRNREKKYSDAEIGMYYSKIREAASRHKLRYTTCYIGNGVKDYYQYQNLWDNKRDCCDVVGKLKSFTATSQNIPWEVRARFAPTPEIAERSRIDAASAEQMYTPVNSKSESGTTSAEI